MLFWIGIIAGVVIGATVIIVGLAFAVPIAIAKGLNW